MPKEKNEKKDASSQSVATKITYKTSERFVKDYSSASKEVQQDIDDLLNLLKASGKFTPGMQPKKLRGRNVWYLRASRGTRITFSYGLNNQILLHRCGEHDMLKRVYRKK